MANLRAAQKEMTRRLLLDAALELFTVQGYAATTIDEVATKAGTTRVTLYAYFPSRAELMRALIDERLDEALQRIRSPEHGSTEPTLIDIVASGDRRRIASWLRSTAAMWPTVRPLITLGREAGTVDPDLRGLIDRWMEEAIGDIEAGLTRAKRFDKGVRHFRGVLAMAQLDYVAQHWENSDWGLSERTMVSELANAWLVLLTE